MAGSRDVSLQIAKDLKKGMGKWQHPDPRLASIIIMLSVRGVTPKETSGILQMSVEDLRRHYGPELKHGRAILGAEILGKVAAAALEDKPEEIKTQLKAAEIYLKYEKQGENFKGESKEASPSDSVKSLIDPKKLSVPELRELNRLLDKASIDTSVIIDVESSRVKS